MLAPVARSLDRSLPGASEHRHPRRQVRRGGARRRHRGGDHLDPRKRARDADGREHAPGRNPRLFPVARAGTVRPRPAWRSRPGNQAAPDRREPELERKTRPSLALAGRSDTSHRAAGHRRGAHSQGAPTRAEISRTTGHGGSFSRRDPRRDAMDHGSGVDRGAGRLQSVFQGRLPSGRRGLLPRGGDAMAPPVERAQRGAAVERASASSTS